MNKRMVVLLVFLLVLIGIIIIGKQREQAYQVNQMETKAANELRRVVAQAQTAKQKALEDTKRIEAEAQKAKQEALEIARRAEAEAQMAKDMAKETIMQKAAEIQAKINELVAQANALLDSGEYQKAVDSAQMILGLDSNSPEAKLIIESAKAKLEAMVGEKVQGLTGGIQENIEAPVPGLPVLDQ